MTRADIADRALKLAGAAGGVLLVGLAVVVLVVVYLALVFRARWGG